MDSLYMYLSFLGFVRNKSWLASLLCVIPVLIYVWVFKVIALNVNYVAFDDIMILGIIPGFENADLAEKWKQLTTLFPEHRLVFSRSVILLLHGFFGKVNLVWPMIIANICWGLCAFVFFRAFTRLKANTLYFVPVMWLWFNIQSFENIFWGVSSLCNFGVLLFILSALYFAVYHPERIIYSLFFAIAATFTYGNGLMVFPVIGFLYLLSGRRKEFVITLLTAVVVAVVYFIDFTPITQNLDFSNPRQVKEGFFGFFGFIGSIATLRAYGVPPIVLSIAVGTGMFMIAILLFLYRKQYLKLWDSVWLKSRYTNQTALFALSIAIFVGITALALTYKRIPTDTFEGMFKGRYRMYSTLWCIALYFAFLSVSKDRIKKLISPAILLIAVGLNLVILQSNFADSVNNRRAAIVQEFNARYNADWLGIRMFSMDRPHFEKIRSYYQSADPVAEGWNPKISTDSVACDSLYKADAVTKTGDHIVVSFENDFFKPVKDYSDGAYVLLKSPEHVYAAPPNQFAVPFKTTIRRQMYFSKGAYASFHVATVEPGVYSIYLLVRQNGKNRIYCTGQTWEEKE
jgi:flagellar biosynthesis protein FliQ